VRHRLQKRKNTVSGQIAFFTEKQKSPALHTMAASDPPKPIPPAVGETGGFWRSCRQPPSETAQKGYTPKAYLGMWESIKLRGCCFWGWFVGWWWIDD